MALITELFQKDDQRAAREHLRRRAWSRGNYPEPWTTTAQESVGQGPRDYFDELLERIRDIRASERRMYLRVRDSLALAADYSPTEPQTQAMFQAVQNQLHFAVT